MKDFRNVCKSIVGNAKSLVTAIIPKTYLMSQHLVSFYVPLLGFYGRKS